VRRRLHPVVTLFIGGMLVATTAAAQEHAAADEAWGAVIYVLGGLGAVAAFIIAITTAYSRVSKPFNAVKDRVTEHHQILVKPVKGQDALVDRVDAAETALKRLEMLPESVDELRTMLHNGIERREQAEQRRERLMERVEGHLQRLAEAPTGPVRGHLDEQ